MVFPSVDNVLMAMVCGLGVMNVMSLIMTSMRSFGVRPARSCAKLVDDVYSSNVRWMNSLD